MMALSRIKGCLEALLLIINKPLDNPSETLYYYYCSLKNLPMEKSYSDPRFYVECDDTSSAISMVGLDVDNEVIMIQYVQNNTSEDQPDKKYYYTCNDFNKAKLAVMEHYYLYDENNVKSSGRFINNLKRDLEFTQIDY